MAAATLLRHARGTRALHLVNAVVVIALLVTGLALGDVLSDRIVAALGGHVRVDATHRWLGLAFAAAAALLVAVAPRRIARLLRDAARFRRGDWRWPLAFARFLAAPRRRAAPFHDGRFDPLQRLVFIGIAVAIVAVTASGVYLYAWTPAFAFGQMSLAYAIRVHIAAAWLLIACLVVHIAAGSGLPWTHRGLAAAMFGRGRVPLALARNLWPAWAERQIASERVAQAAPGGREQGR